jgi:hypothetical protein
MGGYEVLSTLMPKPINNVIKISFTLDKSSGPQPPTASVHSNEQTLHNLSKFNNSCPLLE